MAQNIQQGRIPDKDRREFLKALGVTGAVAAGGAGLTEVRDAMSSTSTENLAPIGQAIQADLGGTLDSNLLADHQSAFAGAASVLPEVTEKGLPQNGPRNEFQQVVEAGQPIYHHLLETGFFESTTSHLPEFTPKYLENSVQAFVASEALADPLHNLGFSGHEGVDLVSTVVANAKQIEDYHWVATDEIPREQIEFGEFIPPMTQGTAGGVLRWLDDLDLHLWQKQPLITAEIIKDGVWHARSMAAGFALMTEGAKALADGDNDLSNDELGALLSTGFAVQAIAQNLLPQDVYWISEEMRAPRSRSHTRQTAGADTR